MLLGIEKNDSLKLVNDCRHAFLFAPAGSGKGVAFFIPNLLHCQDSIICHDINGDNYQLTNKYRISIGQKIFIFNPLDPKTNRYNPFDFIDKSDRRQMYSDIDKIAHLLIQDDSANGFVARRLFVEIAIQLINECNPVSCGGIVRKLKENHNQNNTILRKYLELWENPLIDEATASSDFDIRKFREEASTLYVVVPCNEMNRMQPLMNFIYQYFMHLLTKTEHEIVKDKIAVRFFFDEFTSLGRMAELPKIINYFRSLKVGLFLAISNISQLKSTYPIDYIDIFNSTSYRISFHTSDFETANFIAELCRKKGGFD